MAMDIKNNKNYFIEILEHKNIGELWMSSSS